MWLEQQPAPDGTDHHRRGEHDDGAAGDDGAHGLGNHHRDDLAGHHHAHHTGDCTGNHGTCG